MLKRQAFGYGDSFTADDFPEAPKKDGCYADWNVTDLSDLRFDTTVTAVYRPYVTALAAGDTADGEESHTIRWRVPADGGWKKAQTSTVGSYLCFALPSDSAQFAVVPAMHAAWQLWAAIAALSAKDAQKPPNARNVIRKRRAKAAKRAQ